MNLNLTARYSLIINGTILAVILVFGILFSFTLRTAGIDLREQSAAAMQTSLIQQIKQRGQDVADILAERLGNPLYALDMARMRDLLAEAMLIDGVQQAVIIDTDARIVHDGTPHIASFGEPLTPATTSAGSLRIEAPITLGGSPLGAVLLDVSLAPALAQGQQIDESLRSVMRQQMRTAFASVIGYTVLMLLAGFALATLIARHFVRPIRQLSDYARDVGHGRRDAPPALNRGDEIGLLAGSLRDMSRDLRQSAGEAEYLAYHDSLTRLPNRAQLKRGLREAIVRSIEDDEQLALLFIDLDDFKKVNDTHGHEAGDDFLISVADVLSEVVNLWNAKHDSNATLARLGGDEFTITLRHMRDAHEAEALAERVIAALGEPIPIRDSVFTVGASIGITVCPTDSDDLNVLLRNADRAMYRAKQSGRNSFRRFEKTTDGTATRQSTLEADLGDVLANEGLTLDYQPIVNTDTGAVVAVEALARWFHPVLGYVQPSRFVQLAEQTGRIEHLDRFVLSQVARDLVTLREAGYSDLAAAANVASLHLETSELVAHIEQVLDARGLDGRMLRIEVREKTVMRHLKNAAVNIERLRELGATVWLDNFGTRISTLKHVDILPISGVKIDNEFIDAMSAGNNPKIVTRAITAMCHNLQLPVVAEGVEHTEQLEYLREIRCDFSQGYLFARPMPLDALLRYLQAQHKSSSGEVIVLSDRAS